MNCLSQFLKEPLRRGFLRRNSLHVLFHNLEYFSQPEPTVSPKENVYEQCPEFPCSYILYIIPSVSECPMTAYIDLQLFFHSGQQQPFFRCQFFIFNAAWFNHKESCC